MEQFVVLKEKDLQNIKGGDMRISESIRNLIFPRKKEIKVISNGFIWIRDSYFLFFIISHSYRLICKGQINRKELYVFVLIHY